MAALEAAERKAAGVGKCLRTERDSDNRASLKKKCVHDLRDLCGELAVEANGAKAQMIERIAAARAAPGEASTDAPDAPPAAAAATPVSGIPAGEASADERAAEADAPAPAADNEDDETRES